jgi:hypothetical protein
MGAPVKTHVSLNIDTDLIYKNIYIDMCIEWVIIHALSVEMVYKK